MIRTSRIAVKLESGLGEQMPLMGLNLTVNGEMNHWETRPSLNLEITLEMAYFNEALSSWEPVIEPVEHAPDVFRPFKFNFDVC